MVLDVGAARMLDVTHFACEDDIRCWGISVLFNNDRRKGKNGSLKKDIRKNKANRTPFRMYCVLIICRPRSYVLRERAVISLGEDRLSALTVGPVLQWGVNDKWWLSMEESKSIQIILETFHRVSSTSQRAKPEQTERNGGLKTAKSQPKTALYCKPSRVNMFWIKCIVPRIDSSAWIWLLAHQRLWK